MAPKNEFTVLEGVDGSGKTTVARLLGGHGYTYFKTPSDEFKSVRRYVDEHVPPEGKLLFYVSSVIDASARINEHLARRSAVCDRYIWSSLVTHAAYHGRNLGELEDRWHHLTENLTQPHRTILLDVDEETQLQRIATDRDISNLSASDAFCMQQDLRHRVRNLYRQVAERESWAIIDTTNITPEEIVGKIC